MLKDSGIEPEGIETEQDRSPESVLIDLGAPHVRLPEPNRPDRSP